MSVQLFIQPLAVCSSMEFALFLAFSLSPLFSALVYLSIHQPHSFPDLSSSICLSVSASLNPVHFKYLLSDIKSLAPFLGPIGMPATDKRVDLLEEALCPCQITAVTESGESGRGRVPYLVIGDGIHLGLRCSMHSTCLPQPPGKP